MTLEAYCQTDIGLRRERNEDSFLIDESLGLFLVADGMGGHRGGEVASRLAVESAREVVFRHSKDNRRMMPRQLLAEAYREASHRIFDKARSEGNQELQGMGTTLVCAYRYRNTLYIANVGDSRAYLFSDPYLWQVTEDHSLLNEQLRAGLFSERDIASFGAKNVITRSVGFERDVMCDIVERDVRPGEMILMCSDGLSGLVTDTRIADILRTTSVDQIVSTCINEAKKNGGDDNVTCMLLYARPQEH
ncbi:MAG: Stp1/IreP family PP2C-type Ser/Thr phosphatase [Bdellovibrionaceae bacterium]|nr:Stp1/IreP family PP2C-type Ser/Thr phosphatase [Pseudobdellovibrionaceae bacterium]